MSVSVQTEKQKKRCILRDLLLGIGICECGDWLGKSEIHWTAWQEGQAGMVVHRQNFF